MMDANKYYSFIINKFGELLDHNNVPHGAEKHYAAMTSIEWNILQAKCTQNNFVKVKKYNDIKRETGWGARIAKAMIKGGNVNEHKLTMLQQTLTLRYLRSPQTVPFEGCKLP